MHEGVFMDLKRENESEHCIKSIGMQENLPGHFYMFLYSKDEVFYIVLQYLLTASGSGIYIHVVMIS